MAAGAYVEPWMLSIFLRLDANDGFVECKRLVSWDQIAFESDMFMVIAFVQYSW